MKAILLDEAKKWLEENCENQYTRVAVFGIMQSMPAVNYQETPNEPLTLEELKEMDGEPVFLETGEVAIREQLIAEWEILTEHDDSCFYFTRRKRGFHIKDYGKTWIAYRCPLGGEEEKPNGDWRC